MNEEFRFVISSDTDYEDLCVEIYIDEMFVAIIDQENGLDACEIEIYGRPDGKPWKFNFQKLRDAMDRAMNMLREMRRDM